MAKAEAPLTDAQREIMEIIWDRGEATVAEVRDSLARRRPLARNTVQTTLVRLEERGWLKHREEGRTFIYSANRPQTASLGAKVARLVDRWFAGSTDQLVTALIEYRGLAPGEADRIREKIAKAESQSNRKAPKGAQP